MPWTSNAHAVLSCNREVVPQLLSELLDNALSDLRLDCCVIIFETKQQNAGVAAPVAIHLLPEILVVSDQDAFFSQGFDDDQVVVGLWHFLRHGGNVMTKLSETLYDCLSGGFVDEESQLKTA